MRHIWVALLIGIMGVLGSKSLWAQSQSQAQSELRAECRSQMLTRFDPGEADRRRPMTWRDKAGETYIMRFSPNDAGQFIGGATFIPPNGDPTEFSARFNWSNTSIALENDAAAFAHLLLRVVNTGGGPVYDALAMKPARSGPQIIRYSCAFTCNDRPLRNLLPNACPIR